MSQDVATWIQAFAAGVQAVAAVVVLFLTTQLIRVTREYVETSRQQLDELRQARRGLRPIIHGIRANLVTGTNADSRIMVELRIANLGKSPAIDLSLDESTLFTCIPDKVSVLANQEQSLTLTAVSNAVGRHFLVPLTYHDNEGTWSTKIIEVNLESRGSPESCIVRHKRVPSLKPVQLIESD